MFQIRRHQGKGLKGSINGKEYFVGNAKLIKDLGVSFDASKSSNILHKEKLRSSCDKEKVLGFVMVADEVKAESKQAVQDLHKLGIKVIMLTGDDEKAAKHMASLVGIDEVIAHVLPQINSQRSRSFSCRGRSSLWPETA